MHIRNRCDARGSVSPSQRLMVGAERPRAAAAWVWVSPFFFRSFSNHLANEVAMRGKITVHLRKRKERVG